MDTLIGWRNKVVGALYRGVCKPVFFRMDPETIHDGMSAVLRFCGAFLPGRAMVRACFGYRNPVLEQEILGIRFPNPVGLSAGFDKNAELIGIMPALGFGFTEVGSITGEPCEGNPKPRLWRLKKSKSLAVYYGLKNDGCETVSARLRGKKFFLPVGISIAKTNSPDTVEDERAIADYAKAYRAFEDIGEYVTINISCPNAFGGQPFTDSAKLEKLLERIASMPKRKPVFLKISPDLAEDEINRILEVALRYGIDGFVCTNLTKDRNNPNIIDEQVPQKGGLSGKAVGDRSLELIRSVYRKTAGAAIIVGVGGISSAEDAYKRIRAGASLLELITGMIFEGPQTASEINRGLAELLRKDGYANISEAIGAEHLSSREIDK